jgi:hypothetical protein
MWNVLGSNGSSGTTMAVVSFSLHDAKAAPAKMMGRKCLWKFMILVAVWFEHLAVWDAHLSE